MASPGHDDLARPRSSPSDPSASDSDPSASRSDPPVLGRATDDLAAGRPWKARERLASFVASTGRYDRRVLSLLGDVCYAMADVPEAGRWWLLAGRAGPEVETAIDVFVQESGRDPQRIARQLPSAIAWRDYPEEVRDRLARLGVAPDTSETPGGATETQPDDRGFWVLKGILVALVTLLALGMWKVLETVLWLAKEAWALVQ